MSQPEPEPPDRSLGRLALSLLVVLAAMVGIWFAMNQSGILAALRLAAVAAALATWLWPNAPPPTEASLFSPKGRYSGFLLAFAAIAGAPGALMLFLCDTGTGVMRSICVESGGPGPIVLGGIAIAAFLFVAWLEHDRTPKKKPRKSARPR